jgi:hypothetical protein
MSDMTEIGKQNGILIAKLISERRTGSEDNWNTYLGMAWDNILLFEQLGFLDTNKFWGIKEPK